MGDLLDSQIDNLICCVDPEQYEHLVKEVWTKNTDVR